MMPAMVKINLMTSLCSRDYSETFYFVLIFHLVPSLGRKSVRIGMCTRPAAKERKGTHSQLLLGMYTIWMMTIPID